MSIYRVKVINHHKICHFIYRTLLSLYNNSNNKSLKIKYLLKHNLIQNQHSFVSKKQYQTAWLLKLKSKGFILILILRKKTTSQKNMRNKLFDNLICCIILETCFLLQTTIINHLV